MMNEAKAITGQDIWEEERLRFATEAAGVALWSWDVDTDEFTMDARAFEIWGMEPKSAISFEQLSTRIHPVDLEKVGAAFKATRERPGQYEIDFRIMHGDEIRWVSARGRGDDEGIKKGIMYGVFLDVSYRKQAEEERDLIAREMVHRIKNLFSVSSSLAAIAARSSDTKEEMLKDFTLRLRSLANAHELILPAFHDQKHSVFIYDLLTALLNSYIQDNTSGKTVQITAPKVTVGETSIKSVALLIHELATNSLKYGALSQETGRLVLTCLEAEDQVQIDWQEHTASPPEEVTEYNGFGSEMMERIIQQVNGSIIRDWTDHGLRVSLRMNKALLSA